MSPNIQSGRNLGGPMVVAGDAPKKITRSEVRVHGPAKLETSRGPSQARDHDDGERWPPRSLGDTGGRSDAGLRAPGSGRGAGGG